MHSEQTQRKLESTLANSSEHLEKVLGSKNYERRPYGKVFENLVSYKFFSHSICVISDYVGFFSKKNPVEFVSALEFPI